MATKNELKKKNPGKQLLSDMKFYTDYSKWINDENRKETWEESVKDVMKIHKDYYKDKITPELLELLDFTEKQYIDKKVLGSQRMLQFRDGVLKHNARQFNCTVSYADRLNFFSEAFYLLLCGCGVGFSVLPKFINQLPKLIRRDKGTKTFVIPDSIEGWADSLACLLSSYSETPVKGFEQFSGYEIKFDYDLIRPKGAHIAGGFKAPGSEGLKKSLELIETMLNKHLVHSDRFTTILAYDIVMHSSDAVLSGGVRRSATICFFSKEDTDMMNAKTGNWYSENPQRARSNNSAILVRSTTTFEEYEKLMQSTKEFGEPGFVWAESEDVLFNPCCEIGFIPKSPYTDESGWSMCNLSEINGLKARTEDDFYDACKAASILGTLQAGYTKFKYLTETTKQIVDFEALLGVSITGFMDNPKITLNEEILKKGANIVKETNKLVANMIGIRQAARTTCVKPSGNASVILGTTSGIHPEHSKLYFRVMQINKQTELAKFISENYPDLIEESVWSSTNSDYVIYVPITSEHDSIFKDSMKGIKLLDTVKLVQNSWVESGTNPELGIEPFLRHNVSNTITVDNWEEVTDYIYENRNYFAGISFLPDIGDKIYNQAPFTSVLSGDEIIEQYGSASLLASGLIVDALNAFYNNLWKACEYVKSNDLTLEGTRTQVLIQKDWIKRAKSFANKYFDSVDQMILCLKDVYLLHKWLTITRALKHEINFSEIPFKPEFTDIDTTAGQACASGACEIRSI